MLNATKTKRRDMESRLVTVTGKPELHLDYLDTLR